MTEEKPKWPRDGYRPEWLALEDASGGRYIMTCDVKVDVPTFDAVFSAMSKQWPQFEEELEVWEEIMEPLPDAGNRTLNVRVYKPKSSPASTLPLVIFFHGGGYVAGNLDTEDAQCRQFAVKTPCLLISVNYPKVVEEGIDLDAIIACGAAAVPWCKKRAAHLLDRPIDAIPTILNGGSAGAFLSLQVAHHFVTKLNDTVSIDGLVVLYPAVLPYNYAQLSDSEAPLKYKSRYTAWDENGNASVPVFGLEVAKYIWGMYNIDLTSPSHLILLSSNEVLNKLPPIYVVGADKDVLRDDARILDWRIREEVGGKIKFDFYEGLPHWFHTFPMLEVAQEMMGKTIEGTKWVLEEASKVREAKNAANQQA